MTLQLDSMPQHSLPRSVYVLGVRVDRVSQLQALDIIDQLIALRRASGNTLPCQQVVTVNTEFVMAAQKNSEFRHAINSAALARHCDAAESAFEIPSLFPQCVFLSGAALACGNCADLEMGTPKSVRRTECSTR